MCKHSTQTLVNYSVNERHVTLTMQHLREETHQLFRLISCSVILRVVAGCRDAETSHTAIKTGRQVILQPYMHTIVHTINHHKSYYVIINHTAMSISHIAIMSYFNYHMSYCIILSRTAVIMLYCNNYVILHHHKSYCNHQKSYCNHHVILQSKRNSSCKTETADAFTPTIKLNHFICPNKITYSVCRIFIGLGISDMHRTFGFAAEQRVTCR